MWLWGHNMTYQNILNEYFLVTKFVSGIEQLNAVEKLWSDKRSSGDIERISSSMGMIQKHLNHLNNESMRHLTKVFRILRTKNDVDI